jgi:Protein of unknown function (DUF3298)
MASPGDVQPERDALALVVSELNGDVADRLGLYIEVARWETDAHPGFHPEGPQGLIDTKLRIEDCDIFVGIFWKRFGTPISDASSGTEHEFKKAIAAWDRNRSPEIMFYFKQEPLFPASTTETEQLSAVVKFREAFPRQGMYWNFKTTLDFERFVRGHLRKVLYELADASTASVVRSADLRAQSSSSANPSRSLEWHSGISWEDQVLREKWEGLPGYQVELHYPLLISQYFPDVAQIGEYIRIDMLSHIFHYRLQKIEQNSNRYNFGQEENLRTNEYYANCREPDVVGKLVSIQYSITTYDGGDAHPNLHFKVYNFLVDPVALLEPIHRIFQDEKTALEVVQREARSQLKTALSEPARAGGGNWDRNEQVEVGTSTWEHFRAARFTERGLELLFEPYQVAAYVYGPQTAQVPYSTLVPLMRPQYVSLMQLERWIRYHAV